ncbi:MAG: AAA family ATPase [Lewinellaceae bacterium]|nr:AAA family ATPase [Lewinellaceae bacterium]
MTSFFSCLARGRLTDSQGKLADFCSTIVIMTSNIGAQSLSQNPIGWGQQTDKEQVKPILHRKHRSILPELYNRIDQVIPLLR